MSEAKKLDLPSPSPTPPEGNACPTCYGSGLVMQLFGSGEVQPCPKCQPLPPTPESVSLTERTDAERLDWLQERTNGRTVCISGDDDNEDGWQLSGWRGQLRGEIGAGTDLREAIDDAMKESPDVR